MRLLYLVLLNGCLTGSAAAQSSGQAATAVPAEAISPEDAAFNAVYAGRAIPVVTGRLLNLSADELSKLTVKYTLVVPFWQSQLTKMAIVRPDGSFDLQLDNALPYQQIWLNIKDVFYTALYANTDLYVELDMKKLKAAKQVDYNGEGVRYLGTDGPLNTYLNNYELYKRPEQNDLSTKIYNLYMQPLTDSILAVYKAIDDSAKKFQDNYIAANPSPFGWVLENERLSNYYDQIIVKCWGKTMDHNLWQEISPHKPYLSLANGLLFYRDLEGYVSSLPGARQATGWKDGLDRNIRRLDSLFPPAKADFLKLFLDAGENLSDQELAYAYARNRIHTTWCLTVLNNQYDRLNARLSAINQELATSPATLQDSGFGRPLIRTAFGASLYDASGMNATEFLAKLKNSFPHKALIIDRWATWCIPCLNEMPFSKELEHESTDLPVVFVYLCTINRSTELKWKQKVTELEQPGVHILIDEALDKELSAYFSFNGYPGYALIDQTGKYRRGAITRISMIKDKDALQALIK